MAHPPSVSVGALLGSRPEAFGLPLELMAGVDGLTRVITSPHIQKTGLALAGFHEYLKPGRVLIFGESEIRYLESLAPTERIRSLRLALMLDFPCIVITGGFTPPAEVVVEAERARLPLLKTHVPTPTAIAKLTSILEDSLAERTILHAVLLDILGLGVLLVGESGIGKSECALDLIVRGHRLVADDTVEIRRRQETILIGTCPELTRHHMFPFVSSVEQLRDAKRMVEEAAADLIRRGEQVPRVPVGVMIEIPAAAYTADLLAPEVDFFTIGTNDLIQYCLAVDRSDERVSRLYEPLHPAILRMIVMVRRAASRRRIPVSLCGEMASDPALLTLLVGLGLSEFSMAAGAIPVAKQVLREVRLDDLRALARRVLRLSTVDEIERELVAAAGSLGRLGRLSGGVTSS